MSKEYVWKLPVGGAEKEISCEASGNKYFLYAGDAFVDTFYKNASGDVDEEVTLCGIHCRFVSFGDKPDLVIDGIMLSSGKDYEKEKAARTKANKGFAVAEIVVGVFALASLIIYAITKGNLTALLPVFVIPAGFIALGLYELLSAYKKSKKKEENTADETAETKENGNTEE
ncbi:MAG: hypothetical protein IJ021_05155 [Clostridia bacterium]|nr:hypothetical protein [Clostridia bacterium]